MRGAAYNPWPMPRRPDSPTPPDAQLSLFAELPLASTPAPAEPPVVAPVVAPSAGPWLAPPPAVPRGEALTPAVPAPLPSSRPALPSSPRAQHAVQLGEHRVPFALRRARRRSIGFSIGPDGLAVAAPRWVALADIESALRAKGSWVLRKLHEQAERQRRLQAARVDWREGATLPFLGEPVVLVLDARVAGVVLDAQPPAQALPGIAHMTLRLGLPQHAAAAQIRDVVHGWLQRQARRVLEERVRHFEPLLGVRVRRLALSAATTRWGSASADGSIRLHWRLVHLPMASIDYVVAHELAHLREMNHSPAFWDVVRSVVPDVEQARRRLRECALPLTD